MRDCEIRMTLIYILALAVPCASFSTVARTLLRSTQRSLSSSNSRAIRLGRLRPSSNSKFSTGVIMDAAGFSTAAADRAFDLEMEATRTSAFSDFSWTKQWYPMVFAKVTDKKNPHRLELFGEPIVLWWDHKAGHWYAMSDSCPHRAAPLSEGRVDENGQIECPYHGWTFDGGKGGACTKIPQAQGGGDSAMLARCSGISYAVEEKQGIVWVWGESGDKALSADATKIPVCEALEDTRFAWIDVSRDMPYSADMLLENVLDSSHVPFTHHQTISKRENAVPLPLRLTAALAPKGFEGEWPISMPDKATDVSGSDWNGRATERTTVFRAPHYMHHRIRSASKAELAAARHKGQEAVDESFNAGFETWTVAYATPTGPGRCRLMARFPFRFPAEKKKSGLLGLLPALNIPDLAIRKLPDWANHLGQLKVLDDDNIFLPLQERRVADQGSWKGRNGKLGYVTPTPADTFVNAYRKWFDAVPPPPYAAHAVDLFRQVPLSKATLLDRYAQHTAHCTSCQGALKNAQSAYKACALALLAAGTLLPWLIAGNWQAVSAATSVLFSARTAATVALAVKGLVLSLSPWLALAGVCAGLQAIRQTARSIEQRLTSGLHEYPPPRNKPQGAKGSARELRTVEQGRSS